MPKSNSDQRATGRDLNRILGDVDAGTILAILALHPTVAQLEEARIWLNGGDDTLGKGHHPLRGVVAQIFDVLKADEEEPTPTKR
jgi:hypothetical protein